MGYHSNKNKLDNNIKNSIITMTHKQIDQLEDTNLKAIMKLIKKLDKSQKQLHKIILKNDESKK